MRFWRAALGRLIGRDPADRDTAIRTVAPGGQLTPGVPPLSDDDDMGATQLYSASVDYFVDGEGQKNQHRLLLAEHPSRAALLALALVPDGARQLQMQSFPAGIHDGAWRNKAGETAVIGSEQQETKGGYRELYTLAYVPNSDQQGPRIVFFHDRVELHLWLKERGFQSRRWREDGRDGE